MNIGARNPTTVNLPNVFRCRRHGPSVRKLIAAASSNARTPSDSIGNLHLTKSFSYRVLLPKMEILMRTRGVRKAKLPRIPR
jgi:hypothetical protein